MPLTVAPSGVRPPPRWHAHPYNRSRYYRLAAVTAPRLPRTFRMWLAGRVAGALAAHFPAERAAVRRNLTRVHPERGAVWLDAAVDRVFERFAVCFADLLSLDRRPPAEFWRHVAGFDEQAPTRAALAQGRGCVSITAHLGNWQLAGRLLAVLGRPVHVVMAPEVDPAVGTLLDRGAPPGVRFVRLTSPVVGVELVAALRRGEVVAFQLDRAIGGRGDVEMSFFGAPATFPLGPFVMAGAAGAPVVPAFCVLEPDGTYRLRVEPALSVSRGAEIDALRHAVAVLERYVRSYWDQWFNFFDVWKADR